MRKLTTILFFVCIAMTVFAWPTSEQVRKSTGAISGYDNASGTWRPVAINQDTGALVTDAEVNIGSITVDAFPVFSDSTGSPATATVDANNRAVVNIGSETIGMIEAIDAVPTANYMDVETVSPVTTEIAVMPGRKTVSLFNQSPTETVWVSLDNDAASATVGIGIPLWPYGYLHRRLDPSLNVGLVASVTCKVTVYQDN